MSKRRRVWGQASTRRSKGVAKAMAQPGVEWDPKAAAELRREASTATRRFGQSSSRPEGLAVKQATPQKDWMPLSALLAAVSVGLMGYFAAEISLGPHPLHWLATATVASLGYIGGLVWNRVRGF